MDEILKGNTRDAEQSAGSKLGQPPTINQIFPHKEIFMIRTIATSLATTAALFAAPTPALPSNPREQWQGVYISDVKYESGSCWATVVNDTSKSVHVTVRFVRGPGNWSQTAVVVQPKSKGKARMNTTEKFAKVEIVEVK